MENLDFEKRGGRLPLTLQDAETGQVIDINWIDASEYDSVLESRFVALQGMKSALRLSVERIWTDCDFDSVLMLVDASEALDQGEVPLIQASFGYDCVTGLRESSRIPVVVQDIESKQILMQAYANSKAVDRALETKKATFFSTSKNEIWTKGETSGNTLPIEGFKVRGEGDAKVLLYEVRRGVSGACHLSLENGDPWTTCFGRSIDMDTQNITPDDKVKVIDNPEPAPTWTE